jgi:uncharacterized membrane protein YesL
MLKEYYKKFIDIVFASFLWVLFSFLGILITLGAATTAMFRVVFQVFKTDEPTNVFRLYLKSFKENFFLSTLVWLALVLLFIPVYLMYRYSLTSGETVFLVLSIVGFYQLLVFFIYFFPVCAVFKTKNSFIMIKNVLIIANTNLWNNFKVIGSLVFIMILVFFVHPVFLVLAMSFYGFLVAFHLNNIFKPFYLELGVNQEGEDNDIY